MNYLTLQEVVDEAMLVIDKATDLERNIARTWAYRALQDLGISEDNIKVAKMYPKNLILKKPGDMRLLLDIALYNSQGYQLTHTFHGGKKRIHPQETSTSPDTDSPATSSSQPLDISEDYNAFYLGTNATDVDHALVRYFAYPIDEQGQPMFREDEVMAVIYFIRYMYSLRKNQNRSEIEQNRQAWLLECDRTIARKKSMDLNQEKKKTVASLFRRMIPNFSRNRF